MSRRRLPSLRLTGAKKRERKRSHGGGGGGGGEGGGGGGGEKSRLDMSPRIHPSTFPR